MEKNLEYYMALPYKIELKRDTDTNGYTASIPQLKGCLTCGDDMIQALTNLEDAKREWITAAMTRGIEIPAPDDELENQP